MTFKSQGVTSRDGALFCSVPATKKKKPLSLIRVTNGGVSVCLPVDYGQTETRFELSLGWK